MGILVSKLKQVCFFILGVFKFKNLPYINLLIIGCVISAYVFENYPRISKSLPHVLIHYYKDICDIPEWSYEYKPVEKRGVMLLDACMSPNVVDKVKHLSLMHHMEIQSRDTDDEFITSESFGTIGGTVFLKSENLFMQHVQKVQLPKEQVSLMKCQVSFRNGSRVSYTAERPILISYFDEKFNKRNKHFYANDACLFYYYLN